MTPILRSAGAARARHRPGEDFLSGARSSRRSATAGRRTRSTPHAGSPAEGPLRDDALVALGRIGDERALTGRVRAGRCGRRTAAADRVGGGLSARNRLRERRRAVRGAVAASTGRAAAGAIRTCCAPRRPVWGAGRCAAGDRRRPDGRTVRCRRRRPSIRQGSRLRWRSARWRCAIRRPCSRHLETGPIWRRYSWCSATRSTCSTRTWRRSVSTSDARPFWAAPANRGRPCAGRGSDAGAGVLAARALPGRLRELHGLQVVVRCRHRRRQWRWSSGSSELARSTFTDGVLSDIGAFGGLFRPELSGLDRPGAGRERRRCRDQAEGRVSHRPSTARSGATWSTTASTTSWCRVPAPSSFSTISRPAGCLPDTSAAVIEGIATRVQGRTIVRCLGERRRRCRGFYADGEVRPGGLRGRDRRP